VQFNDLDTVASLAEVLQPVQEAKMQIGHLIEQISEMIRMYCCKHCLYKIPLTPPDFMVLGDYMSRNKPRDHLVG
jgi:hypothetical protein